MDQPGRSAQAGAFIHAWRVFVRSNRSHVLVRVSSWSLSSLSDDVITQTMISRIGQTFSEPSLYILLPREPASVTIVTPATGCLSLASSCRWVTAQSDPPRRSRNAPRGTHLGPRQVRHAPRTALVTTAGQAHALGSHARARVAPRSVHHECLRSLILSCASNLISTHLARSLVEPNLRHD